MDSEVEAGQSGRATARTKILAYLGELKPGVFISSQKLCCDLALRFTTAKNVLTTLEDLGLVQKKITTEKGTVASFRINPNAGSIATVEKLTGNGTSIMEQRIVPFVPPEWSDAYGKHPYSA